MLVFKVQSQHSGPCQPRTEDVVIGDKHGAVEMTSKVQKIAKVDVAEMLADLALELIEFASIRFVDGEG
jgi:hypothetical protein